MERFRSAVRPHDCGLVLAAIAGADPNDPTATSLPYSYDTSESGRRFRIGVLKGVTDEVRDVVRANFEKALETLSAVADVEEIEFPDMPYEEITRTILFAEASSAFEDFVDAGLNAELTAPEDHYGPFPRVAVLAKDYLRAMRLRGVMAKRVDEVMARYDVLAAPTNRGVAPPLDQEFRGAIRGSSRDIMGAAGNGAGLPAISVPSGFSAEGLPTGIQFMARPYQENRALAAARAYQGLTAWHTMHPAEIG